MLYWLWLTPLVLLFFLLARRRVRIRARRAALRAVKQHRIKINRFQLLNKALVKESLLEDPFVRDAAERHAAREGVALEAALERVETYLDEIVPSFSVFSYYRFGRSLAGGLLRFLYQVSIEPPPEVDRGAQRVYVINHRSNVDYVLVAYALLSHVSISYAVGEWARVWPLETIFKSFGSYFLRRGHREELYHAVLERYVARITREGVTQGIFVEGGLSRDGAMRPPKIGLLDYIVRAAAEEDFPRDVVFVPVGLNYDRVLEDRVLVREQLGLEGKPGRVSRFQTTTRFLLREMWRAFRGERERFGLAAVRFGEPVSLGERLAARGETLEFDPAAPFEKRKVFLGELAAGLVERIGKAVPVTAATFGAAVLARRGLTGASLGELEREAAELREVLRARGASFAVPLEAEALLKNGLRALEIRRLVERSGEGYRIRAEQEPLVEYYANSLKAFGL